jgi:hypothetical protein
MKDASTYARPYATSRPAVEISKTGFACTSVHPESHNSPMSRC